MEPIMYYLDFAWSQPPPWMIRANGYDGVCVYLGNARPDAAYFWALREAGLHIVLIQEWETTSAYGGYDVGVQMAVQANDIADAIGAPLDCSIAYVAADTPYTGDEYAGALASWREGIRSVGRRGFRLAYGNEAALRFSAPDFMWGVETWSDERNYKYGWFDRPNVAMIQMANTRTRSVPGYDTDENEVYLASFGQWGAAPTPAVAGPPVKRYTEGAKMLKFTDAKGTTCEFYRSGQSLIVRYWNQGLAGPPIALTDPPFSPSPLLLDPSTDLLAVEAYGVVLVHAAGTDGHMVEAYPTGFGYIARAI